MSEDNDVGAVAPATTEPVMEKDEVEEKAAPKPYEPPEDIGAFPADEEPEPAPVKTAAPAAASAPPPTYAPAYAPREDPWGKPVEYSGEDVYAKGSKLIEDHVRERVGALATTVGQVVSEMDRKIQALEAKLAASEGRSAPLPKVFIEREHKTAAQFCTTKLREFSEDPAWANPKVRGYMEAGVRQYLKEAAVKAKKSGDVSDYNFLTGDGFLEGVFHTAKVQAGYKRGVVPSDVSSPEATLEHVRSRGSVAEDDIEITPDMKAAAKAQGVPISKLKEQMRASQKWNKERA